MKSITIDGTDYTINDADDYGVEKTHHGSKTPYSYTDEIIDICNKNLPKIEFIGFYGEFKGQYTNVLIKQDDEYTFKSIKKLKAHIIEHNFKYTFRKKLTKSKMNSLIDTYIKNTGYKLKSVGDFNYRRTIITIECDKNHITEKTVNLLEHEHLCGECDGPKSLKLSNLIENIEAICKNEKYHFNGFVYENGARSILDLTCENNHNYKPLYYNFVNAGWRCGECASIRKSSKECRIIEQYFIDNNINFKTEYRFNDCKNIFTLPFDFYLPDYNLCIEYDGIQHYQAIDFWGGEDSLEKQKLNDNIKNKYCIDNDISLIRIKYDEIDYIQKIVTFIKGIDNGQ